MQPGDVVAGHTLVARLGGGRFSEVWRAEFEGRVVALKVFAAPRLEAPAQEALGRIGGRDGRWFPRVERLDLKHAPPYMRMELLDGRTLDEAADEPDRTLEARLALAEQILEALSVVHARGFVHGDLSPTNVLVRGTDVKVIDVGLGVTEGASGDMVVSGRPDVSLGVAAPLYAAPERFGGEVGPPADIFSFGKLLYRLITRDPPYAVKPLTRKYPELGASWDEFIFRCLEEDPSMRFAGASAALVEFRRLRERPVARAYRSTCPHCAGTLELVVAVPGARLNCPHCRGGVEVRSLDPDLGEAVCGCVACETEIPAPRATVKFCPRCGRMVRLNARVCWNCRAAIDDYARILQDRDRRTRPGTGRNFWPHVLATLLGYLACWFPGALLNLHFLAEAAAEEHQTGARPPGRGALEFLAWTCLYTPLLLVVAIVVYGALRTVVH